MLFNKYHIIIYKDRESGVRNLRLRGWIGFLLFFALLCMASLNIYLWQFYDTSSSLEKQLQEAQRTLQEKDSQMMGLSTQLDELAAHLYRVEMFDTRLKVLMNIDKGQEEGEEASSLPQQKRMPSGIVLKQHKDLYARHAFSLVNELTSAALLEEVTQQDLLHFMHENKEIMLSTPSIWPARGRVTSLFGRRRSPFGGGGKVHKGIDISNTIGTPVIATAKGIITFAARDNAYGNTIIIDHGNNVTTRYAHLNKIDVRVGQQVQRGDVIGALGNTGRSTGPHLHYEVQISGVAVNPMRFILN